MCNLISELEEKIVTVYKVAAKKDNKYYSPALGIEYKIGKVEIPTVQNRLCKAFTDNILDTHSGAYNTTMIGRTAGFKYLKDAKIKKSSWEYYGVTPSYVLVILKIQLSQELLLGNYIGDTVYAGKEIVSMKEI